MTTLQQQALDMQSDPTAAWLQFDANPPTELLDLATAIHGPEMVTRAIEDIGRAGRLTAYKPYLARFIAIRAQSRRILQQGA